MDDLVALAQRPPAIEDRDRLNQVRQTPFRRWRRELAPPDQLVLLALQKSQSLEMLTPVSLSVVCFRVNPADTGLDEEALEKINRNVLARVFWEDRGFMSSTLLKGTFALRLCILNHTTTWDDVRETLEAAERFGREASIERRAL